MEYDSDEAPKHGWKHWLWMALCCIPMIAIVLLLMLGYWSLP